MTMNNEFNLLILTVYFLCVTYVMFQMVNAFNDEYTVKLEKDELDKELKDLKIADRVEISFKFDDRYEVKSDRNKLKELAVTIKNKSDQYPIYVDWDCSAMTDWFGERARRLTRLVSGSALDISQEQVFSVITPGRSLQEKVVPEDILTRKGEKGEIEVAKTLLDLTMPPFQAPEKKKQTFKAFIDGSAPLYFTVDLVMRLADRDTPQAGYPTRIRCKFKLSRLGWKAGLPWNPKKS
jgi:hypothetical protein